MFNMVLTTLTAIILAVVIIDFARSYLKAEGTGVAKVWAAARESATVAWQQAVAVGVGLVTFSAEIAEMIDPSLQDTIKGLITPDQAGKVMILIAGITIVARLRTLVR